MTDTLLKKSTYTVSNKFPEKEESETSEEILLRSNKKITIECGKSSITLHPNGKIVLKGEYIFSDANGVNRISGGRLELN
ncbi:hypothetical protein [Erwinia sorbitola]|uniref:DUF2345 domain-containing protein n=1 Tax=Erwinia sorbitola TaxID=2681984 RepID=A0A6I6EJ51_9GAMM|nr:hypothetical protein [Erwinia sorbitola]MTD28508.1 hypothetical protein [Erwinia sorbitola]QGU86621.1 hypothetical protein GN242_05035 [Erwinia sorbitola]